MLRLPVHPVSEYLLQLQNALPWLLPRLAYRFTIGAPHFGHIGAPSSTLCWRWPSMRSFVMFSVKPPVCLNDARLFSKKRVIMLLTRAQRIISALAEHVRFSCSIHGSKRSFCLSTCSIMSCMMSSPYCGASGFNALSLMALGSLLRQATCLP